MGIVLARIDDRLVHGVVVTQWARAVDAQRIMVIDDEVAVDETRKAAMRMSKPVGTGMSLIDTETAINNFKAGRYDDHNVLLVVNNVDILLKLLDEGISIPKVNIGIMLDSEERKKYTSHFAATEKELSQLKEIESRGVPVTVQFVPSDKEESINVFN